MSDQASLGTFVYFLAKSGSSQNTYWVSLVRTQCQFILDLPDFFILPHIPWVLIYLPGPCSARVLLYLFSQNPSLSLTLPCHFFTPRNLPCSPAVHFLLAWDVFKAELHFCPHGKTQWQWSWQLHDGFEWNLLFHVLPLEKFLTFLYRKG